MFNRLKILLVWILLLGGSLPASAQETTKLKLPQQLDQILNWLPPDSETLIVANGPFEYVSEPSEESFLEQSRFLSLGFITGFHDGLLAKQLQGKKVAIAVEASRRFTPPKVLGMMPFEGCQVIKFGDSELDAVDAAFESCMKQATNTIQLGNTTLAVFELEGGYMEVDVWTLLFAKPQRGTLLCATNQKFLEQVLDRMNGEQSERAFPDALPEWQHVDLDASVWAMRHYRKEFAETDPSSPLRSKAAANSPDPLAKGFVFSYDAKSENTAKAIYLSESEDAVKILEWAWERPHEKLMPTIKQTKPGVVEITASITKDNGYGWAFLFVLYSYLGHGIYV